MKKLLLLIIVLFFPAITSATSLLKNEACSYEDGIHRESLYVYWPGKYPTVDEFVKKNGKLHYFIQVFPTASSLDRYRVAGNSPYSTYGFIKNSGSYLVSYDCARSKVEFSPYIRSTRWDQYGKFSWIDGDYLDYTFAKLTAMNTCYDWPDTVMSLLTLRNIPLYFSGIPRSTKDVCIARWPYKSLGDGNIQFDIEKHDNTTDESWYSRYQYEISSKKLRKVR